MSQGENVRFGGVGFRYTYQKAGRWRNTWYVMANGQQIGHIRISQRDNEEYNIPLIIVPHFHDDQNQHILPACEHFKKTRPDLPPTP